MLVFLILVHIIGEIVVRVAMENWLDCSKGKSLIGSHGFNIIIGTFFCQIYNFELFDDLLSNKSAEILYIWGMLSIAIGIVGIVQQLYDLISEIKKNQEKNSIEDTKE